MSSYYTQTVQATDLAEFGKALQDNLPHGWGLTFRVNTTTGDAELNFSSDGCEATMNRMLKGLKGDDAHWTPSRLKPAVVDEDHKQVNMSFRALVDKLVKIRESGGGYDGGCTVGVRINKRGSTEIDFFDALFKPERKVYSRLTISQFIIDKIATVTAELSELKKKLKGDA